MVWDYNDDKNRVPVYVHSHIRKMCSNCGGALRKGAIGVIDKRLQEGLATCMKCKRRITTVGFYSAHKNDFKCMNPSETEKALEKRKIKKERKKAKIEASKEINSNIIKENKNLQVQPSGIAEENSALTIETKKNEILEIITQTNEKLSDLILEDFKTAWRKVKLSIFELDNLSSVYFVRNNDGTISSIIISRLKKITDSSVNGIHFITSRSELANKLYDCYDRNILGDSYEIIEKIYFKELLKQADFQERNITVQQAFPKNNITAQKDNAKETSKANDEDIKTVYVYFRLTNTCMKHKHLIESVTAKTTNARNGATTNINVFHCKNCNKYFINYEALQKYISKGIYPALPYKLSNDISGSLHDASKLMLYGYRVAEGTLSRQERQSILSWIIDSDLLTKSEIIKDLQFKVRYNGSKPGNEKAKSKWEDDIQFVSRYVKNNKKKIKASFVLRNR